MLYVVGLLLAITGSTVYFLAVWKNYNDMDKNWALILGLLGTPGTMYLLIMLTLFSMDLPDYTDNIILFFGIAVLGVNLGRTHIAPEFAKIISREKKCRAHTLIMMVQWETYLIFTDLISVIIWTAGTNAGIPLRDVTGAMVCVTLGGVAAALVMAFSLKRYLAVREEQMLARCMNLGEMLLKIVPGHAIGLLGLAGAVIFLLPYMTR